MQLPTPTRFLLARGTRLVWSGLALLLLAGAASGQEYVFTTVAGAPGGSGSSDGLGSAARFSSPCGVAMDSRGNLFVADTNNHTIRRITPDGLVTTVAGSAGERGFADGAGRDARFNAPTGVAVDSTGTLFVADTGYNTIRKIAADGEVTTLAGVAGGEGAANGTGTVARFYAPRGIAVDSAGNVFVADSGNQTIRRITPAGVVTTLAGLTRFGGTVDGVGSAARFENLEGLTIDAGDNLYATQGYGGGAIRRVTPMGVVTTVAGKPNTLGVADGPARTVPLGNPHGVAVDRSGNVFIADTFSSTIRKLSADGFVTTIAGSPGNYGSEDGTSGARFYRPRGIAVDAQGNLFVADTDNHNIRKIAAGSVTTFAGGAGAGADDGLGNLARFNEPIGVAVDRNGSLFVTEGIFHPALRKISSDGLVSTLANVELAFEIVYLHGVAADSHGNVVFAEFDDGSDWLIPQSSLIRQVTADGILGILAGWPNVLGSADGLSTVAAFNGASGVAMDALGNVFVADTGNHTIRRITTAGVVSTVAGLANRRGSDNGEATEARFNLPEGIAVDGLGNLYVADTGNHSIRKITAVGLVSTLAGSAGKRGNADGLGDAAQFDSPRALAVDAEGNVFVADTGNHTIRRVTPDGIVSTVAGLAGSVGSADGVGGSVRFNLPSGVAVDERGNLFVADTGNNIIRRGTSVAAPAIAVQPLSQTAARGRTVMLSATASGSPAPTYQWTKGGVTLTGATDATLILTSVSDASAGNYQCLVTNTAGITASATATVTVVEEIGAGRFNNLSVRTLLNAGRTVVAGFVIDGPGQKAVLVRGVGPALTHFGVNDALVDPRIEIFNGVGQLLAENDNWPAGLAGIFASTGAFAFSAGSKDAAILLALPSGSYAAVLSGVGGAPGEALIEIYEAP